MAYREWFNLRVKLVVWAAIYGGWAVYFLVQNVWFSSQNILIFEWGGHEVYDTLFNRWLQSIAQMTPVLAVLGGIDLFAEEKNNGTLSFLLTRPLSRRRIYLTKIILAAAGLVTVLGLTSLLVLAVDRLPRQIYISRYNTLPCQPGVFCTTAGSSRPVELVAGLVGLAFIVLVGLVVLLNAGLVSIFCRNMFQAFGAAMPGVGLAYFLLLGGGRRMSFSGPDRGEVGGTIFTSNMIVADAELLLFWFAVLAIAGVTLIGWGMSIFRRAEF